MIDILLPLRFPVRSTPRYQKFQSLHNFIDLVVREQHVCLSLVKIIKRTRVTSLFHRVLRGNFRIMQREIQLLGHVSCVWPTLYPSNDLSSFLRTSTLISPKSKRFRNTSTQYLLLQSRPGYQRKSCHLSSNAKDASLIVLFNLIFKKSQLSSSAFTRTSGSGRDAQNSKTASQAFF